MWQSEARSLCECAKGKKAPNFKTDLHLELIKLLSSTAVIIFILSAKTLTVSINGKEASKKTRTWPSVSPDLKAHQLV